MRRIVLGFALAVAGLAAVGLGLAWAYPDLAPPWARFSPKRAMGAGDAGLFCKEHGVPEKFCTLCHEELTKTLLLCKEHGDIPEEICTLCHPEAAEKFGLKMCKEHGLPEAYCGQCGNGPQAALERPNDGWCAAHNTPEAWCLTCKAAGGCTTDTQVAKSGNGAHAGHDHAAQPHGPGEAGVCREPLPLVRLKTPRLAQQVGLLTSDVVAETHAHTLEATAETAFDANRYADVSPRVGGFLREVRVDLGQQVQAGDVLAVVDSPAVSTAKSRHLSAQAALRLARAEYERTRSLVASNAVASRQELETLTVLNQAESSALDAAQDLRNLGFLEQDLARITQAKDTSSLLSVVAPIVGTVVKRHAVRGEAVEPATLLFAVADTASMWLWIDVYEADIEQVKAGQDVTFTISGAEVADLSGKVTWVGAEVDETTRTTRVRAELANPAGRLRANQFGRAVVQVGQPHEVVVVPKAAVQSKDATQVVFLPQEPGVYRPQRVVTRPATRREVVEIAWGLEPGDRVVTKGSFWLKTEIMKGAIGAGCCE